MKEKDIKKIGKDIPMKFNPRTMKYEIDIEKMNEKKEKLKETKLTRALKQDSKNFKDYFKRFIDFLKEDSWKSLIVTLILAFLFIKLIFFPVLSFITGTTLPLVIVESCSMYHSESLQEITTNFQYKLKEVNLEEINNWPFQNGINKGDIIFVLGAKNLKVGDVLIFANKDNANPIIHRIIQIRENDGNINYITTKGDNNPDLLEIEEKILPENFIGKASFRIPYLGWIKLIFYEWTRVPSQRGLCKQKDLNNGVINISNAVLS
jgi:hypothetical protein